MEIRDIQVQIRREMVFHAIDCYPESPVYEAVLDEYEEIYEQVMQILAPRAFYTFGTLNSDYGDYSAGTRVIFVLASVGEEVSLLSTRLFAEGNYLAGMLTDAMADCALMDMDARVMHEVVASCKERGVGISERLEAPGDIPIEIQKEILDHLAEEAVGIDITEGMMYNPVKTLGALFLVSDKDEYRIKHNCKNCCAVDCKFRDAIFHMRVDGRESSFLLERREHETVLEALRRQGLSVPAVCAGKGICGQCKVRFIKGASNPTKGDIHFFTEKELADGMRLACKAVPEADCRVTLSQDESDFFVLASDVSIEDTSADEEVGIAIDIGTTTIAMQLVGLLSGKRGRTYTTINNQRSFGADVISRIQASNEGGGRELRASICEDLRKGILTLMEGESASLKKVTISANTTMVHLLMGYSCETLGVFPFTPVTVNQITLPVSELFLDDLFYPEAVVTILPGISTYVGGDITAGIYVSRMHTRDAIGLLIDLGTNGEMVIGSRKRLICTSVAAGPAFEGGNILCGTGSVPGAVSHVKLSREDGIIASRVETIGGMPPVGICGTGVVDTVAQMVFLELINETGRMKEEYVAEGLKLAETKGGEAIILTQKDIREIQLAKAAISAGVELLALRLGVTSEQIDRVYLAGGFGYRMDVNAAIAIGLFPEHFKGRVELIGNSSLNGAIAVLLEDSALKEMEQLAHQCEEISLSSDPQFNQYYMDGMYFETESMQ